MDNQDKKNEILEIHKAIDENSASSEELQHAIQSIEDDESIPQEVKEIVRQISVTQGSFRMSNVDPLTRAFSDKLQPEHIDKFLDIAKLSEENEYKDRVSTKRDIKIFVFAGIAVFIFLIIYLAKDNTDLLMSILRDIFAFVGGFGAGSFYKWKKHKEN